MSIKSAKRAKERVERPRVGAPGGMRAKVGWHCPDAEFWLRARMSAHQVAAGLAPQTFDRQARCAKHLLTELTKRRGL